MLTNINYEKNAKGYFINTNEMHRDSLINGLQVMLSCREFFEKSKFFPIYEQMSFRFVRSTSFF